MHITETSKSHMDPFQEIVHICNTAYSTTLSYFLPIIFAQGLFIPSLKRHYTDSFFPSLSLSGHRGACAKAQLLIKEDEDGLCVILT